MTLHSYKQVFFLQLFILCYFLKRKKVGDDVTKRERERELFVFHAIFYEHYVVGAYKNFLHP